MSEILGKFEKAVMINSVIARAKVHLDADVQDMARKIPYLSYDERSHLFLEVVQAIADVSQKGFQSYRRQLTLTDISRFIWDDDEFEDYLSKDNKAGNYSVSRLLTLVPVLVKSGVDVNKQTGKGYSGLRMFADIGQTMMVRYLLTHGADINTRDKEGVTPYISAAIHNNIDMLTLLEGKKANIWEMDNKKQNALMYAIHMQAHDVINYFLHHKEVPRPNINHQDESGYTVLMQFALLGDAESVKKCGDYGADPTIRTNGSNAHAGKTAHGLIESYVNRDFDGKLGIKSKFTPVLNVLRELEHKWWNENKAPADSRSSRSLNELTPA